MNTFVAARLQRAGVLDLAQEIARTHHVPLEVMLSTRRKASVVRARHELWCVTRDTLALSYPETGELFGVHHTTVLEADRARQRRLRALFLPSRGQTGLEGRAS